MWQYVIRDYFRAYRWNNVKHAWKTTSPTSATILVILILSGQYLALDKAVKDMVVTSLGCAVPIILAWFATVIHPMVLPKMFYLCPMDRKQRRQYVINSYILKIVLSMLVSLLGIVAVMVYYHFDIIVFVTVMLNNLIVNLMIPTEFAMKTNFKVEDKFYFDNIFAYKELSDKECAVKIGLVFAISVFTGLILIDVTEASMTIFKLVIFLIMLAVEIPLMLGYRNYIKLHINAAEDYEDIDV